MLYFPQGPEFYFLSEPWHHNICVLAMKVLNGRLALSLNLCLNNEYYYFMGWWNRQKLLAKSKFHPTISKSPWFVGKTEYHVVLKCSHDTESQKSGLRYNVFQC